jgi:uncharacterized protein YbjT (DUF2867 family)
MYAIMGITGRVGGTAANALLASGQQVRAIVRDANKGAAWAERGAEVAVAEGNDADALQAALTGVEGAFLMTPPYFAPEAGYPETRGIVAAVRRALEAAAPPRIVCLSSVGAHRPSGLGLITQSHIMEQELGDLGIPAAFVRAASFMENVVWDIPSARDSGEFASFLQPLDRAIPMIATADIGHTVAETLRQTWTGRRVIELEGPRPYSPNDVAHVLGDLLGHPVRATAAPREEWESLFERAGMPHGRTWARMEMLDGFNSGWITFEREGTESVIGPTPLEEALRSYIR